MESSVADQNSQTENFVSAGITNKQLIRLEMRGNFASSEAAMEGLIQTQLLPIFLALNLAESMPLRRIHPWIVLKLQIMSSWKGFFENRNFRRHKQESSHVTCYQACKLFEIFIICLAFLLMQKVNVTAITVKSTSRELNEESFSNCPGTFSVQISFLS